MSRPRRFRTPDGVVYCPVILKVESWDEYGRPEALTFLPDDRPAEQVPSDVYVLAYVREADVEKKHEPEGEEFL